MYYATWPHGVSTHRLWWNWYNKPLKRSQVWTMCLLHDVLMRNGGGNILAYAKRVGYGKEARPYVRVRRVRREFNGSRASVWLNEAKKAAFIVAGNIPDQAYKATMTIDTRALPAGTDLTAYDAMVDQELGSIDQPMPINIRSMGYRMLTVGLRIPLAPGTHVDDVD